MIRFVFKICHDGEWELREGEAVIARYPTRGAVLNLAQALVASARARGDDAEVAEIGPCPELGRS